ncbi:hypothetical protein MTP99_006301 [Tenebrio molitor]|nr:hypothetical protein MTP99_006301 [Tenebrio molitor]
MTPVFHLEQPDRVDKDYTGGVTPQSLSIATRQSRIASSIMRSLIKSLLTPNLTQSVTNVRTTTTNKSKPRSSCCVRQSSLGKKYVAAVPVRTLAAHTSTLQCVWFAVRDHQHGRLPPS